MEEETEKIDFKQNALNREELRDRVQAIGRKNEVNPAISAKGTTPDKKLNKYYLNSSISIVNCEMYWS